MGLIQSSSGNLEFVKPDNLERPLVQVDTDKLSSHTNDVEDHTSKGSCVQTKGPVYSHAAHALRYNLESNLTQDNAGSQGALRKGISENGMVFGFPMTPMSTTQGSSLTLEVIKGPSQGISHSVLSPTTSNQLLTLGRIPPSDVILKDSEVSGKHAMINWNLDKLRWELVDMGSLNGTLVNSESIKHPKTGSRNWGDPVELSSGDLITLGTTSQIHVKIESVAEHDIPFGVGIASDPMAMRRGGKKLPMEDICYCQWPLPGVDQFGVFGVCDGHGGAGAAKSASKLLPEMVANILAESFKREIVLSRQDASDVLRDAFSRVEASLDHSYEGCTATLLLVWVDSRKHFLLQCANVGDSACLVCVDGIQMKMTEDHRITSSSEIQRMKETGQPLKDGDTRLCGLNLGRMLGDKFLKERDSRFSSKAYVSPVVHVDQTNKAFALLASDGFWDVVSPRKAVQLVLEARERYASMDGKIMAEKVAASLVNEARARHTKDNTSVVYLDFDCTAKTTCKI